MIDLEQEVEMTWINNSIQYYQNRGYIFTKVRDKFNVKLKDVSLCSNKYIVATCDYCGAIVTTRYCDYNESIAKYHKYSCANCKTKKAIETNLIKYGKRMFNAENISLENLELEFKRRGYIVLKEKINCDYITDKTIIYYKCLKHSEHILHISYADFKHDKGCRFCGIEKRNASKRTDYKQVNSDFKAKDLILLTKDYKNNSQKLEYICIHHPNIIQTTCYTNLKNIKGCRFCCYERNSGENHYLWNGGISDICEYLRKYIEPWKKDSRKACNSKSILSGKRANLVHHLYNFYSIINEIFDITKLEVKSIGEYTRSELKLLENICLDLHYKYGLGVCLTPKEHLFYHAWAGRKDNTPEQFAEFKARFAAGEFSDAL